MNLDPASLLPLVGLVALLLLLARRPRAPRPGRGLRRRFDDARRQAPFRRGAPRLRVVEGGRKDRDEDPS
ncbi:MAG: hypothetical protein V2J02_15270 [Pseudomonadales bacterium]|jgi:hypothetical protein|nr:hypothetical protein [Pseudomonadales bacterium]